MRSKIHLAALAATFLVFSWQPVLAQDDEDDDAQAQQFNQQVEQQQAEANERSKCTDAITDNADDPDALLRMNVGISPDGARLMSKVYSKVQEDYVRLMQMKQYLDTLDGVKLMMAGKGNAKARELISDLQNNIEHQMEAIRGNLISLATTTIEWAAKRCENLQKERHHENSPSISFGFGVDTNVEGGGHHHHHHHKGCAVQQ